jgi:aconitate hydratase
MFHPMKNTNTFSAKAALQIDGKTYSIYRLDALEKAGLVRLAKLPVSIRILLENQLRQEDGRLITAENVKAVAEWQPRGFPDTEIPFIPSRVLLQDFTGVPLVVDLAAMRDAAQALGEDPQKINPLFPVDLVIDHSVQVDFFGSPNASQKNAQLEYERNQERYSFLKWAQKTFSHFRAIPPDTGIVHQINLEYLAPVVGVKDGVAFPDTVIGTDSHTTMINGLGVLGWGVGGIEAEAAMLGQPMSMLLPEVVGVRLTGQLPPGTTATDAVLTLTQLLRQKGVVGKFVEFLGPGVKTLSLPDRATIANMAPEYGATMGFFPVDEETLNYLRLTGRSEEQIRLVEIYNKEQGLFAPELEDDAFSDVLTLNLDTLEPCLAGPKRPQDRVLLKNAKSAFLKSLAAPIKERGFELSPDLQKKTVSIYGQDVTHGAVVIAAITSCTNTSNPSLLMGAGLLAKKAVEKGLSSRPHVKTSLAPGSQVVTDYLAAAGLTPFLEKLGFHTVGYGCTTCIGNSGPLPEPVSEAVKESNLVAASVLSGNRNFEGRVNPLVKANYLASPPLVVAYALAGRMDLDLATEPLGQDKNGNPVFLKDLWPTQDEIAATMEKAVTSPLFRARYSHVTDGDKNWNQLPLPTGNLFPWDEKSTYIRRAPYFDALEKTAAPLKNIEKARVLGVFGDSVTTDHISPAGNIAQDSPAARYLTDHGVAPKDFNQYGARRGNHEVMIRGTFANIRLKNGLVNNEEGWNTLHLPSLVKMPIYEAAQKYKKENVPLLIIAGKEYGSGSSRDWAAKGTALLGVRAVIAESYERIHRSNLAGMGVLPLQFMPGENRETLGLTGQEVYAITGISDGLVPKKQLQVKAITPEGHIKKFSVIARVDTPVEIDYLRQGGILPAVLKQIFHR